MSASLRGVCAFVATITISWAGSASGGAVDSLYARMGGKAVVSAVVTETIDRAAADPQIGHTFEGSNLKRIKEKLAEQICQLAQGGCAYTGDSMRDTHAGHHISDGDFYRLVEILRDSMRHQHVHLRERNELLALLAPMERDVVEPPAAKAVHQ